MYARRIIIVDESFAHALMGKEIDKVIAGLQEATKQIGFAASFDASFAKVNFWGQHYSKERQVLYPFDIRFFNGTENVTIYGKSNEKNIIEEIKIITFQLTMTRNYGILKTQEVLIMDRFYWSLVRCQTFDFEAISESWLAEQCGLRNVHYLWL